MQLENCYKIQLTRNMVPLSLNFDSIMQQTVRGCYFEQFLNLKRPSAEMDVQMILPDKNVTTIAKAGKRYERRKKCLSVPLTFVAVCQNQMQTDIIQHLPAAVLELCPLEDCSL